jgi:GTP-binding protein Era
VREKIFRQLGDEVPYGTAVAIDSFTHEGELRRIRATVYVDKASQRPMLLGEGGARMKAIATQARFDMEQLFGGKVFLEVWVRVKRGWADSETMLTRLGY